MGWPAVSEWIVSLQESRAATHSNRLIVLFACRIMITTPSSSTPSKRWPPLRPEHTGHWLNLLSIAVIATWLLGWLLGRFYFFELFTHFQLQYYALSILLVVAGLASRLLLGKQGRATLTVVPVLVFGLTAIFSDTSWLPGEDPAAESTLTRDVRVLQANVLYSRSDYAPTFNLIRSQRPDLYVLQEMTPASIRLVTSQLSHEFPYWFACWSKGPCWVLVGSRTPIMVNKPLAETKRIIALTTQVRGRAMGLVTVHPRTPVLPSWFRERNDQLTYAAEKTRTQPLPTVLLGDFNISIFSPVYKVIFRSAPPVAGATPTVRQAPLRPARQSLTQPTWPRFIPPMMIPIDHIFTNQGFRPFHFRTLDHPGSDHRAIVADLSFSRR
jgi:endonuclease/exonuclease/phosphatase (EEP) superfamily protein YafD